VIWIPAFAGKTENVLEKEKGRTVSGPPLIFGL